MVDSTLRIEQFCWMSLAVSGEIRTRSTEMMKSCFLIACQLVITFLHDPSSQPCRVLRECRVSRHTPGCCVCIVPQSCETPGSSCPVMTCSTTHLPPSPLTLFHLKRDGSDIHTTHHGALITLDLRPVVLWLKSWDLFISKKSSLKEKRALETFVVTADGEFKEKRATGAGQYLTDKCCPLLKWHWRTRGRRKAG